ncbi:hypothetical protein [Salinibacter ruber]|uniref:hypothetical protein n=1 Tax=Salinibacter ruber TaxID=146919 RepID=UPI0005BACB3E|nr:hypothetical protein [Salinibacter ruber]
MDVLGDRLDRERRVRVGHDSADGLDPRREAGRPVVRLAEDAIASHLNVQLRLRLNGLGGLVRRTEVPDVAFFSPPPLGVEIMGKSKRVTKETDQIYGSRS